MAYSKEGRITKGNLDNKQTEKQTNKKQGETRNWEENVAEKVNYKKKKKYIMGDSFSLQMKKENLFYH